MRKLNKVRRPRGAIGILWPVVNSLALPNERVGRRPRQKGGGVGGHDPVESLATGPFADRKRRILRLALFGLTFLSAIAVGFGTRDGEVVFMMYRQPKLLAIQLLGWLFVLLYVWWRRDAFGTVVRGLGRDTLPALLVGFIGLLVLSLVWATVRWNSLYELLQYAVLLAVFLVIVEWARDDDRVRLDVVLGMVVAMAVATVVGLVQARWAIPFLSPIDPQFGVENPSLMGYKNPMAQALLAQIYLLAFLVFRRGSDAAACRRRAIRLGLGVLLVVEMAYLGTLQSRAVYTALILTAPVLIGVLAWRALRERRVVAAVVALTLMVGAFAVGVATVPGARERLSSIGEVLGSGIDILGEDRPVYASNTLVMVRDRPFGVGVGNWQVLYPVYRSHGRGVAFSEEMQVRRAHSDPVQFLGEAGWQGLGLWVALLGAGVLLSWTRYRRDGDDLSLFVGFQIAAVAVAGTFDYIMDLPYGKLQVVLLLALAAAAQPARSHQPPQRRSRTIPIALTVVAVLALFYTVALTNRSFEAATIRETYERHGLATANPGRLTNGQRSGAVQLDLLGRRFESLLGQDKTFHKDFLILAHAAWLNGDPDRAAHLAGRSLELQPYYPNALRFLAMLYQDTDPELAARYAATYDYVLNQATEGFRIEYPPLPE